MSVISLAKKVIKSLPLANIIVFESVPDLSDNTKAVFDQMIKLGINKKYKCIWVLDKPAKDFPKIKNVKYVSIKSKLVPLYFVFAKCFVCCNKWLTTLRKDQKSFYLSHGSPIKSVKGYYNMPQNIDYCFAASENMAPLLANELKAESEKMVALGYPRNDVLTAEPRELTKLFPDSNFKKCIVWYPTFRQHKDVKINAGGNALPIIYDDEMAIELNEVAKQNQVLIVLKPHFAQDVSCIKDNNLSNIKIINDDFFKENKITSYEFVGSCDALITDYSSIYYDYTLCDKPIALIWEDFEEYKKNTGIAENSEQFLVGGEKIYDLLQLKQFVVNVANRIDELKEERNRVCDLVNHSRDGKNAERVTDFIIKTANLQR